MLSSSEGRGGRHVYQTEQQAPLSDLYQRPQRDPTGLGITDRSPRLVHLLNHQFRGTPVALLGRIHGETERRASAPQRLPLLAISIALTCSAVSCLL